MDTKIVLVDDEAVFTALVKANLEDMGGYQVTVVNDSSKAIDTIRETRPDVILLDIIMPGVDGGDVLNALESDPDLSSIPVLIVTAMIDHESPDDDGVVKFGDHILLAKPISADTLVKTIQERLAQ